jgi:molybdenum cofactor cytidylyltransferase
MISAIILAAGMSKRMGRPKQLLQLGNKPLIRIVVENVLASAVDEIIVVTGCEAEGVGAAIKDLPVKITFNPDYQQGQGTSLAVGVKQLDKNTEAFLVFMCDQPLISPSMINTIIDEFKKRGSLALRPTYNETPGHPVVFSSTLSSGMEQLHEDEGARKVLERLGARVDYLALQDEGIVIDMDTPESYEKLKKKYRYD